MQCMCTSYTVGVTWDTRMIIPEAISKQQSNSSTTQDANTESSFDVTVVAGRVHLSYGDRRPSHPCVFERCSYWWERLLLSIHLKHMYRSKGTPSSCHNRTTGRTIENVWYTNDWYIHCYIGVSFIFNLKTKAKMGRDETTSKLTDWK